MGLAQGRLPALLQPGHQLLPAKFRIEGNAGDAAFDPTDLAFQWSETLESDHDPLVGGERNRGIDLDAALSHVPGRDELGPRRGFEQGRAKQFDTRHSPALARLAHEISGQKREDVDRIIEAKPDIRAAPPFDDSVDMIAAHQLELHPLAWPHRKIDMENCAGPADLADRAYLAHAPEDQRARLEIGGVTGETRRIVAPGDFVEKREDRFHDSQHLEQIAQRGATDIVRCRSLRFPNGPPARWALFHRLTAICTGSTHRYVAIGSKA